jgi:hypothetical protein
MIELSDTNVRLFFEKVYLIKIKFFILRNNSNIEI